MQIMHKSTHDRPLADVHWPIHRGRCRGSGTKSDLSKSTGGTHRGAGWRTEAILHVTTRGLDSSIGIDNGMLEPESAVGQRGKDRLIATESMPPSPAGSYR